MTQTPPRKLRLDQLLVDRGLVESREKAKAMILAGEVQVNGQKLDKAGQTVAFDSNIVLAEKQRYVSRGGFKLEGALKHFGIEVAGFIGVDVGSSTGGFTDCLLQHGAAHVYAFDVGTNQMDWRLRNDPRVTVREGVNARYLTAADIPAPADIGVCDVSFISVTMILPALASLLKPSGQIVILVKPQFEVGRADVGKGGIVRDPDLHAASCAKVAEAAHSLGFETQLTDSPILGAEGNREFLLYGHR